MIIVLQQIQHVQIVQWQQSINFAFTPASMSGIIFKREGGRFPNSQSTHKPCYTSSFQVLVHYYTPVIFLCMIHPFTTQAVFFCRSPIPFQLLILTPEGFRLVRCLFSMFFDRSDWERPVIYGGNSSPASWWDFFHHKNKPTFKFNFQDIIDTSIEWPIFVLESNLSTAVIK